MKTEHRVQNPDIRMAILALKPWARLRGYGPVVEEEPLDTTDIQNDARPLTSRSTSASSLDLLARKSNPQPLDQT